MRRRTPAGAHRIHGRTTRHAGYAASHRVRKRIEEAFGWIKSIAGQEKTKFRGRERVGMGLHLRGGGLQSGAAAQTHVGADISAPANCKFVGRWRIDKADIWDRDHLDLCGPTMFPITDHGRGEITFGAL
jgi:hypothetical protein